MYLDKKTLLTGTWLLVSVVQSCDTREDWFQKEGEDATFFFTSENRVDTLDLTGARYVTYNVGLNRIDGLWQYSDTLHLSVSGKTSHSSIGAQVLAVANDTETRLVTMERGEDGSMTLSYQLAANSDLYRLFDSDTVAHTICTSRLRVLLRDIFDNQYYAYININYVSDCPPIPVLELRDVDGKPLEKVISLANSYDKDGSVVKYEYCIDGNIVNYNNATNRMECIEGKWQSGKAAYGGTYVTATALNEINHAFQSSGEHVVYYRCMDNQGAWSTWKKQTVMISD